MKLWNFEDIEKKGQDAVDIEVLHVAKQFMRDGNLVAHPLHKEGESGLGLWKARFESIIHKGSTLVRVYRCPMDYYTKMPNRLPNFCLINTKSCLIAIWRQSRNY